jgi:flavodoxin
LTCINSVLRNFISMGLICIDGVSGMGAAKILVVFYSRSGMTRRIAQALAAALHGDLEEITEPKSRSGFLGYLRSATEARRMRPATIVPAQHDVAAYDLVIVGTPVWAWSLSSPVRAFLMATAARLPEVAFFCTLGGAGSENAFAQMTAIIGKQPRAVCAITQREVLAGNYAGRLAAFQGTITAVPT